MSASKKVMAASFFALLGIVAGGCGAPPGMVDTLPPGADVRAALLEKVNDGEPAAIGEASPGRSKSVEGTPALTIAPALPTKKGETKTTESGVVYETIKEGQGAVAKAGQTIIVHYTGTFDDGREFDSSKGKDPLNTMIGMGRVIKGWDEAIPGMKKGEIRKLTVPPSAAYGALGQGKIPPNATLHFEVELINTQ